MPRHAIRSILVGIDLTARTDPVLQTAHSLAESADAELHLLHAFDFQLPAVESAPFQVEDAARRTDSGTDLRVVPDIRTATEPADELVLYAEEKSPDLLVLGTHGRGRVARALIGSVASSVVRRVMCPVLLVPPPREGENSRE